MVQTRASISANAFSLFRTAAGLAMQLVAGLALIVVASLVALITAIAGLTLAAAAFAMRFAAPRYHAGGAPTANGDGAAVTLEARRTPRGWTVE